MRASLFLCLFSLISSTLAFYTAEDDVVMVTPQNFKREILDAQGPVIAEYFAPWCGHCQKMIEAYKTAAKEMKNLVKFVAINCDSNKDFCKSLGIKGYPTVKYYGKIKTKSEQYASKRTAEAFIEFAKQKHESYASEPSQPSPAPESSSGAFYTPEDSITLLTPDNFKSEVLESDKPVIVEYYAPWCGFCKKMKEDYKQAAADTQHGVKFAALDCDKHKSYCQKLGVKGYPTIKFYGYDKSTDEEYKGDRSLENLLDYVREKETQFKARVEQKLIETVELDVLELKSEQDFQKECLVEGVVCVITFHKKSDDEKLRAALGPISIIKQKWEKSTQPIAEIFKPYKYVWVNSLTTGKQLRKDLLISENYNENIVAAVDFKRRLFRIHTGVWNVLRIESFLDIMAKGIGRSAAFADSVEEFRLDEKPLEIGSGESGKIVNQDKIDDEL